MSSITYINHKQLSFIKSKLQSSAPQHNWTEFCKLSQFEGGFDSMYVRQGRNTLPFINGLAELPGFRMPRYNSTFNLSYGDVTDIRCRQLRNEKWDRPWLVLWSGGVDSTLILTSILKNLSPAELENIHVVCNRISVYEAPRFFYNHIEPNFHLIDSSNFSLTPEILSTYYVINGEPNDQLFFNGPAVNMVLREPDYAYRNFRTDPDYLLKFLSVLPGSDPSFAKWHYETQLENIESVDIPVETYQDFFWWFVFNVYWTGILVRSMCMHTLPTRELVKLHMDNFIRWFVTDEYQWWSMVNNMPGIKCGSTIASFKLPAKQYIYEYDRDEYYFNFKVKLGSTGHYRKTPPGVEWFCLLDDFTPLYFDRDSQQINELLMSHIQC